MFSGREQGYGKETGFASGGTGRVLPAGWLDRSQAQFLESWGFAWFLGLG